MTAPPPAPWRQGWPVLVASAVARCVLACLLLLVAASVVPSLWGWQSTVVSSGSMEPTLSPGDVVVVRPVAAAELTPAGSSWSTTPTCPAPCACTASSRWRTARCGCAATRTRGPDTSPVPLTAVHGVGALRFPGLGLPALWLREHRLLPVAATAAVLLGLAAVALLHRTPGEEDVPGPPEEPRRRLRRRLPARALRCLALGGVGLLLATLPGAGTPARAVFSGTATNPGNSLAAAAAWSCGAAVGAAGATEYYPLQESAGTTAVNAGSWGSSANATYSTSGVTYGARGPRCAVGQQSAITLDGTNGAVWTPTLVTNPQTFSEQIWFATTTTTGGKLIGFGDGTGGAQSGNYDRHVYMTDTGQLSFGVFDGATHVVTSPASYNDGDWHLAVATFSAGTGMRLYVDGAVVGRDTTSTVAQNFAGYWRIGYDNVNTWPAQPSSYHFAGSLAHAAVYGSVLSASQVSGLWTAAPWSCTSAAGSSGAGAALYWPLQEGGGTVATDAGTVGAGRQRHLRLRRAHLQPHRPELRHRRRRRRPVRREHRAGLDDADGREPAVVHRADLVLHVHARREADRLRQRHRRCAVVVLRPARLHEQHRAAHLRRLQRRVRPGDHAGRRTPTAPGTWSPARSPRRPAWPSTSTARWWARNPAATAAQVFTGSWRVGADSVGGWPSSSGAWFTGRLAHASVTYRVLTADEVAGQYLAGK